MAELSYYRGLAARRLRQLLEHAGRQPLTATDAEISNLYRHLAGLPPVPGSAPDPYRGLSVQPLPLAEARALVGRALEQQLQKMGDQKQPGLDAQLDRLIRQMSGLPPRPDGVEPYVRLFPPPATHVESYTSWDPGRAPEGCPPRLTLDHYRESAQQYGIPVADLWAFAQVESNGGGFLPDGRLKVLFEGQWFWFHLQQAGVDPKPLSRQHPTLVYPRWTLAYYLGGAREWERVKAAEQINRRCAWLSTSWGMFQLMGFNHRCGGYDSVEAMVADYQSGGEPAQLRSILHWMNGSGVVAALRRRDYRRAIEMYNGPGQVDRYLRLFLTAQRNYPGDRRWIPQQ